MKSCKIYTESYIKLENLRLHIMTKQKRSITKVALLDTLISLYSDALTKTQEGEKNATKI